MNPPASGMSPQQNPAENRGGQQEHQSRTEVMDHADLARNYPPFVASALSTQDSALTVCGCRRASR